MVKEIIIGVGYIIFVFGMIALIAIWFQLIDEYKHRKEE